MYVCQALVWQDLKAAKPGFGCCQAQVWLVWQLSNPGLAA
jgi:hypothetical protein